MNPEIEALVEAFNEAVERYNLARLEYAMEADGLAAPPVARAMPSLEIERADAHRPAALSVQAVRDFFEGVFDGEIIADRQGKSYGVVHRASTEMTRLFFQVSLARMGISPREMLD